VNLPRPEVSVVVPTRDRVASLARCLDALDLQRAPSFEVVVVDDASRDARGVSNLVARHSRARLVRGTGQGPAAARNLGARAARAPWLCFTDDDCRPRRHWIVELQRTLASGAAAVAGPVVAARPGGCLAATQTITNHLVERSRSRDGRSVAFAPTNNLACTRDVLMKVPFDEQYPLAAGEDRDWCRRAAGHFPIRFVPEAVVVHDAESTFPDFWRQQVRYGRGAFRFHQGDCDTPRVQPFDFYTSLGHAALRQGVAVAALVGVAQAATAVGYALAALADR
jgi:cellulose synthase/poly-beta-1,6-N-acetylglucosamine synthase-like glycosyltransferase